MYPMESYDSTEWTGSFQVFLGEVDCSFQEDDNKVEEFSLDERGSLPQKGWEAILAVTCTYPW